MNNLPKVSVITITYGHDKYIVETIKSILKQKYNGIIELIIANDNSPDDTDKVIKDFFNENNIPNNIHINYTSHKENKGMLANFTWALKEATGKYITFCEGDDYWIDPLKLQKQVDFLEENTDTVLVYTDSYYYFQTKDQLVEKHTKQLNGLDDLLIRNQIWTLTVCIRKDVIDEYLISCYEEFMDLPFGDYPIWLFATTKGKLKHINDITTVYRVLDESASHSKDPQKLFKIVECIYRCKLKFIRLFKSGNQEIIKDKIKGVKVFTQLNIASKSRNKEIYNTVSNDIKYIKYYNKKYYYLFSLAKINFILFSFWYKFLLKIRENNEKIINE